MRLAKTYFKIVAGIFLVFGVVAAIAPDPYMSLLDVEASAGGRLWGRGFGAAALAFGCVLWILDPSFGRERRIGASGAAFAFIATAVTDAVGTITDDFTSPLGWTFVIFNAAMAALALSVLRAAPSNRQAVLEGSA